METRKEPSSREAQEVCRAYGALRQMGLKANQTSPTRCGRRRNCSPGARFIQTASNNRASIVRVLEADDLNAFARNRLPVFHFRVELPFLHGFNSLLLERGRHVRTQYFGVGYGSIRRHPHLEFDRSFGVL